MTSAVPRFIEVAGSRFRMGRQDGQKDEAPVHEVVLSPFLAARDPVLNDQYRAFLHATGLAPPPFLDEARFSRPGQPVVGVTWDEATAYCDWLGGQLGRRVRLPTEAERESAARGGRLEGDWPWAGDRHPAAADVEAADGPHEPTEACANGFGLRCMAENVHEWCSDWYSASSYADAPLQDPGGPATGTRRSARGGSWRHRDKFTRVTARSSLVPAFRYSDFGFRVYADP